LWKEQKSRFIRAGLDFVLHWLAQREGKGGGVSLAEVTRLKELYEFGPFRVDAEKETLLRAGEAVALTPKNFQILLVLVRHSQEVVTKDDLLKTVWPDTFVEEANLSRNIFMLRKALGEGPQDHKYILTVPGRGYRLAENVRLVADQEFSLVAAHHQKVEIQVTEKRSLKLAIAIAALLVVAAAFGAWRFFRHGPVLGAKDTVVLAEFANSTGDKVFDDTLRQGIAIELEQSPYLSLVSDQRIRHTLGLMGMSADTKLTPELARQVCARTGSAVMLEGSIASLGSHYVLSLSAKSCSTGETLDDEMEQAARKEDVLNALSQVASRFRRHVGESLETIDRHNIPLAEATTSSLEALESYTTGWKVHSRSGATASMPFFRRAVEIDPNFAMAHATLGRIYSDLDEPDLSAESLSKAWELRGRTSDREKFFITANYEALVTGNMEEARQTCETWARIYPRDAAPTTMLSGYVNRVAGRYAVALDWARKSVTLDPDFGMGYYNLGANSMYLNHLDEAGNALRLAAGRGLELDEFLMLAYDLAFLKGDRAGMEQASAQARQRTDGEGWISNKEAFALAYYGHLGEARHATDRAVGFGEQAAQQERAGLWEAGAAVREALYGNVAEARRRAEAALKLSRNSEVEYGAAFALARSGDIPQAETLADDIEKRFPEDTSAQFSYLPTLKAMFALQRGDAAKAVEELESAVPYETGVPRLLIGAMYPAYVRGEAFLAEGRGAEAATEFQKILDHREVVVSDPVGALARLELGRAYRLSGENARAKAAYEDFFVLWKNADANVPVLMKARSEYAAIRDQSR
jgi:DNA-binding winged helix-turn-helix (wHTH) protein/tetratricopeptide (TPR) repeat protein